MTFDVRVKDLDRRMATASRRGGSREGHARQDHPLLGRPLTLHQVNRPVEKWITARKGCPMTPPGELAIVGRSLVTAMQS